MNNLRGAKIIYQESKATQPSHLYFLQKDENYCDAIITSESGAKRKLNINVDLSNYYTKTEVNTLINSIDLSNYYTKLETYSKNEVDDIISDISVVDVSNLVPYTGATKNVNIGAFYFESSAGFKKTGGTPSQYLMADGSVSTLPTDLIKGTGTVNYLTKFTASGTIGNSQIFDNGTNVGIGTTSPQRALQVNTVNTPAIRLNNSNSNQGIEMLTQADKYSWLIGAQYNVNDGFEITPSTAVGGTTFLTPAMAILQTGNVGIGTSTPSEKLDVDGNVKANGFKTPTGTANQSLTADGGVFNLNTKADLVGGKVPKTQSQPSTMVMNSSTYVITFTDATGAVQTIDLPLESLFQDANYDAQTKSLIVTLQDGTTRTIPLTDLVDLPEIVLATTNPAVNPTTGQKVYFNTSLGKVWFNVSGAWSGGYSLINTITTAVTSTTTVGAINAGDIIPAGTTIQELAELLLNKTFYPTFANPTFNLTNNAGLREVGSSFNVTLTFNFNRGQILGKLDNGIWNPTMLQDYRAGIATSYLLNGVSGSNNSASFNVTTILGNNNLNGSVTYATGVQPKDSKNNNYDNPLPSGTSPIQSTSFEGIYPYFYYKSTSPITPAIMQSAIANGQATKVLASSTGTITIPFAANGEYIAVAYPSTSTTKTIWYVNALDNGEIPGGLLGVANILPCNSPTNLWNNVNFKIHVSAGLITQTNPIQLKNS